MSDFLAKKVVSELPDPVTANTIYFVRTGVGFDIYVTNNTGTIAAVPLNRRFEQIVAISDISTAIADEQEFSFPWPRDAEITDLKAWLGTVQASGSTFTVDVLRAGSTMLTTPITIDNTEHSSRSAAAQPVINDGSIEEDDLVTVRVTQIGNGSAKNLIVTIYGFWTD